MFSESSSVILALNVHQQSPSYVRREANQAAHYLAKYALKNVYCIWIEETPPCISAVMAFDLLPEFR
jgi:hypothetical protein